MPHITCLYKGGGLLLFDSWCLWPPTDKSNLTALWLFGCPFTESTDGFNASVFIHFRPNIYLGGGCLGLEAPEEASEVCVVASVFWHLSSYPARQGKGDNAVENGDNGVYMFCSDCFWARVSEWLGQWPLCTPPPGNPTRCSEIRPLRFDMVLNV